MGGKDHRGDGGRGRTWPAQLGVSAHQGGHQGGRRLAYPRAPESARWRGRKVDTKWGFGEGIWGALGGKDESGGGLRCPPLRPDSIPGRNPAHPPRPAKSPVPTAPGARARANGAGHGVGPGRPEDPPSPPVLRSREWKLRGPLFLHPTPHFQMAREQRTFGASVPRAPRRAPTYPGHPGRPSSCAPAAPQNRAPAQAPTRLRRRRIPPAPPTAAPPARLQGPGRALRGACREL